MGKLIFEISQTPKATTVMDFWCQAVAKAKSAQEFEKITENYPKAADHWKDHTDLNATQAVLEAQRVDLLPAVRSMCIRHESPWSFGIIIDAHVKDVDRDHICDLIDELFKTKKENSKCLEISALWKTAIHCARLDHPKALQKLISSECWSDIIYHSTRQLDVEIYKADPSEDKRTFILAIKNGMTVNGVGNTFMEKCDYERIGWILDLGAELNGYVFAREVVWSDNGEKLYNYVIDEKKHFKVLGDLVFEIIKNLAQKRKLRWEVLLLRILDEHPEMCKTATKEAARHGIVPEESRTKIVDADDSDDIPEGCWEVHSTSPLEYFQDVQRLLEMYRFLVDKAVLPLQKYLQRFEAFSRDEDISLGFPDEVEIPIEFHHLPTFQCSEPSCEKCAVRDCPHKCEDHYAAGHCPVCMKGCTTKEVQVLHELRKALDDFIECETPRGEWALRRGNCPLWIAATMFTTVPAPEHDEKIADLFAHLYQMKLPFAWSLVLTQKEDEVMYVIVP